MGKRQLEWMNEGDMEGIFRYSNKQENVAWVNWTGISSWFKSTLDREQHGV